MKFTFALGIAAVLAASAALAQDFQNPGGGYGPSAPSSGYQPLGLPYSGYQSPGSPPSGYPPSGYPPPGARPLDPPGGGPVDSSVQVIGPPMSPDNQYVPLPSPAASSGSHPTIPTAAYDGGWIAGAGVLILEPRWSSNPAYDRLGSNSSNTQTLQTNVQTDFNMGAAAAPLVWLGYVGDNGLGIRARWSKLSDSTSLPLNSPAQTDATTTTTYSAYPASVGFAAVSSPNYNDAFVFGSDLTMEVADLEILWDVHPARGSLVFGAGVRYAHLAQNYNASWVSTPLDPTQDTYTTTLTSGHDFNGLGPVISVEAAYPLGQTGFRVTGSARGSLLFGTGAAAANMVSLDADAYGDPPSQTLTSNSQSLGGTLPVLEFELGADWGHNLGAYRFALETALVGQIWFCGGNASNCASVFGSSFPQQTQTTQDAIGVVGVRVAAAMSY